MGLDEGLLLWVNQGWAHPALDLLFTWVSDQATFAFPLLGLLLVDAIRRAGRRGALLWLALVAAVGVGDQTGNLLKQAFGEPRPCTTPATPLRHPERPGPVACDERPTGMPSNHALNFTLAATFLARTTPWRAWQVGVAGATGLVMLSRVYLGRHLPSQVLGGAVLGFWLGMLASWLACYYRLCSSRGPSPVSPDPTPPPVTPAGSLADQAVSLVVPLYNEAENVGPLIAAAHAALASAPWPWELVLVDDGSTDGTARELAAALERYGPRLRVIQLQRNFGQTAAMQAGIDAARGQVIVTLDGDLQNDPADIPGMVARLFREDLDLLVGWRRNRQDNLWLRKIPSFLANRLIGRVTGVRLHDYGCSLKVFRASVLRGVRLYGEMHRFIPAWLALQTSPARIREQVVSHRPRLRGLSKYGIGRTYRVVLDLLSVHFFLRFLARPGHFFGRIGLSFGLVGGAILGYLLYAKVVLGEEIGTRPLLSLGVLLVVVAAQFLTTGVLSELMARTYFAAQGVPPYVVRHDSEGSGPLLPDTPAAPG